MIHGFTSNQEKLLIGGGTEEVKTGFKFSLLSGTRVLYLNLIIVIRTQGYKFLKREQEGRVTTSRGLGPPKMTIEGVERVKALSLKVFLVANL